MAEYAMEQMMDIQDRINNIELFSEMYGSDIKCVAGLTFENGRIVLDGAYTGGNDKYNNVCNTVNNDHLKKIPHDAFAFANFGFNGPAIVKMFDELATQEFKEYIAESFGISTNVLTTAVYDVVSSINGDITLALNHFDIEETYEYDYYYDEYRVNNEYDVEALVMADVVNSYIYENIPFVLQGISSSADGYHYELGDMKFNISQNNNTLCLGINTSYDKAVYNSVESKWAGKFDNSIAYIAVDIQNLLSSKFGKKIMSMLKDELSYDDYVMAESALGKFDSVWYNIGNNKSFEFVISLTDTQTNSVAQIVNFVINNVKF
jgi:hypothetical protein